MGGVAGNVGGENPLEDVGGRGVFAGIDEQGEFPARQVEGVFDIELEVFDQFDAFGQPFPFQPGGQPAEQFRADGVVAAAGVADGEDDDGRPHYARLRLCTSRPSASTSSTASGILPSAWVAQDRQGSKARMATSMWLSRPSVTSRPCR
ncbi:hypothetical protein SDC9_106648 [bioreactor metagenome]|uniref:Uncharacterized protein n=1 Tax=bioreactor metagenome TaxID=1076179 RepID=A0A645B2X6_9ZZZZ